MADLDDRQISKRLHEIGNRDTEVNQPPDLCPIQDTANENESKSCAECKDFKTHRVFNALIVIIIAALVYINLTSFLCSCALLYLDFLSLLKKTNHFTIKRLQHITPTQPKAIYQTISQIFINSHSNFGLL